MNRRSSLLKSSERKPMRLRTRIGLIMTLLLALQGIGLMATLNEGSAQVRTILVVVIAATTLLAFVAIFLLASNSTRKIANLSKHIEGLSPEQEIEFEKTGIREIDELTSAVTVLNNRVVNASKTTSQILEMTSLPIGVYEITDEAEAVTLTDYLHHLIGVELDTPLSKQEWAEYFKLLTAQTCKGHTNVYCYKNPQTGEDQWLRILEHKTDEGFLGVVLDITKDIEENQRLTHQLDYDSLTGLYNRTAFKREAFEKINEEPEKIGAMIFSDLDNLKYINDTFGHDTGDRMLIRAGEMFKEFTHFGGVVARISGDEFAVYLHGFSSKNEARPLIYDQLKKLEEYNLKTPNGGMHRIRSSSGIAWYPSDSDNVTDLLKLSDYAMYEVKHTEKGATYEFDMNSYKENVYLLENREAINRLLDEQLIRFAFQPIVNLKTGEVYAYEALMRSLLDDFKSPMEILAVAAAQSKLSQLERLVTITAFEALLEHVDALGDAKIFMNSIPSQILSDEDHLVLERRFSSVFNKVVLEITEAESKSPHLMNNKISRIKSWGLLLAIDDFGSGFSNEMRMLSVDPDIVKIDMGLIQGIHKSKDKQKLVANLVSFAHSKEILVVAEGVEEKADLERIVSMDLDFAQGYYLGHPAFGINPIDEERQQVLDRMIEEHKNKHSISTP